jgi:hypothetical protein
VVWPHGEDELQKFLFFLNSIHQNIKFTMDIDKNSSLPFLDVLVNRQPDGSLGHTVYGKPTHTVTSCNFRTSSSTKKGCPFYID